MDSNLALYPVRTQSAGAREAKPMKSATVYSSCALAAAILLCTAPVADATEEALGRSITGAQITPYVGIIPPTPGWQYSLSYLYYDGNISGSKQVPIAGTTALNLHANANLLAATFAYVWNTGPGRWNFASMFTVPEIYTSAVANLSLGPLNGRVKSSSTGLYDFYFAPVIASYHVSEVEHWSLGMYIYAPTGDYKKGQLTNEGLNVWTFSPAVGYTHLFQAGTLEMSALAGVDFYTRDNATNYQNGAVFRLDGLAMKRFPSGWGLGLAGGWIQQLEDDSGPTADKLNGFVGHSLGLGPAISYSKAWSKENKVALTLRWLKEFDVKNRIEGEPLMLNVSISL
ncbi:MAG: transporter [Rhodanobacter sp.]